MPEPATASSDAIARAAKIKVLLMDVDGVLTDGKLYYLPGSGEMVGKMVEAKGFNSHDGLGLHFCFAAGILTGVISGRESPGVVERARMLNMKYVYQGLLDKVASYEEVLANAKVTGDQVAFVGDDFTDVPLFRRSGLAVAVANAREEIKDIAHYVTTARGGEGAIREVVELILKAQGVWEPVLQKYLVQVEKDVAAKRV